MASMYDKIKQKKGERFARAIRDHHNGIFEIPDLDLIVRHAGDDAAPLLPYLTSLIAATDDSAVVVEPEDPFVLLDRAGYDAFYADTLEKQNSIARYFEKSERLCTFNDAARHENCYIVHAVKKDVDQIRRDDFMGREDRQDVYGTSVISIQIAKHGGFIKITSRYNNKVDWPDNTFNSNPDNIISGLTAALRAYFDVEFEIAYLPEGFTLVGTQIFKYHMEVNNILYGDQAWVENGVIKEVDLGRGDAMFDRILFNGQTKRLESIDPKIVDSFVVDFNHTYASDRRLKVTTVGKNRHLALGKTPLITAKGAQMTELYLYETTKIRRCFLLRAPALTLVYAPYLKSMERESLISARMLKRFIAPLLKDVPDHLRDLVNPKSLSAAPAVAPRP